MSYITIPEVTERLVRERERRGITGTSRSHWYRLMREDRAPKPIAVSEKITAWALSDLQRWVALRIAGEPWSPETDSDRDAALSETTGVL